MDTMTLLIPMVGPAGHGLGSLYPGGRLPGPPSIGDQQAEMALRACGGVPPIASAGPAADRSELICLHCGAEMRLLEDRQIGAALHLSAECPRCGCLRATYIELSPLSQRFLELPQEASFD
jgi:hypothetical protein